MNNYTGVYRAVVTNNIDPEKRGRIKVLCPSVLNSCESAWANPCMMCTGQNGLFFIPEVNNSVWIMFEEGNPDMPIWIGSWVIPTSPPPSEKEIEMQEKNPEKIIVNENKLPIRSIGDEKGLLKDYYGLSTPLGDIHWCESFPIPNNKEVKKQSFSLDFLGWGIKGSNVYYDKLLKLGNDYSSVTIKGTKNSSTIKLQGTNVGEITLESTEQGGTLTINCTCPIKIKGDKIEIEGINGIDLKGSKININS